MDTLGVGGFVAVRRLRPLIDLKTRIDVLIDLGATLEEIVEVRALLTSRFTSSEPSLDAAQARMAARAAVERNGLPDKVTIDCSGANAAGIAAYREESAAVIEVRQYQPADEVRF